MATSLAWKTVTIPTAVLFKERGHHANKQSLRMLCKQMASVVDPDSLNPDPAFKVNPDPAYGSRVLMTNTVLKKQIQLNFFFFQKQL
jgi:hypothetical protein